MTSSLFSKIENQKLEFKAQSKIGSLDNVKHKPGGGDIKIFDDKTYMKQVSASGSGTQTANCDLSIVTEVHGSSPKSEESGTDIRIRKTTTLAGDKPEYKKSTEVTVSSRSPSKERRYIAKSPSTEVKLTYSTVSSPTKQSRASSEEKENAVEVVKVPASEHAPILNPSAGDWDASPKPELPSRLSSAGDRKETEKPMETKSEVKDDRKFEEKRDMSKAEDGEENGKVHVIPVMKEPTTPISKFIQNEIAAHEKVGEIWKEVQNASSPNPNAPIANPVQKPQPTPLQPSSVPNQTPSPSPQQGIIPQRPQQYPSQVNQPNFGPHPSQMRPTAPPQRAPYQQSNEPQQYSMSMPRPSAQGISSPRPPPPQQVRYTGDQASRPASGGFTTGNRPPPDGSNRQPQQQSSEYYKHQVPRNP